MKTPIDVFSAYRMAPTAIDEFNTGGRDVLIQKFAAFKQTEPIEFIMLGYPFKSSNQRDKVIGTLPDLAEEVSIDQFKRFGAELQQVHPAGARFNFISDGLVFNDQLEIPDSTVDAYADAMRDMTRGTPMTLMSFREFYNQPLPTAREKLTEQFGIGPVELEKRILFNPNVNALYRGMKHFMEEELAAREFPSKRARERAAGKLARSLMFRNEAYSALATHTFPKAIRLSMHPTTNNGEKYSIQLIPSPKAWTSPWHCALVVHSDGVLETIHRADADRLGYTLVYHNNRPYNYVN